MAHGLTETQIKTLEEFAAQCAGVRHDIRLWMDAAKHEKPEEKALREEAENSCDSLRAAINLEMFWCDKDHAPGHTLHMPYVHVAAAESWIAQGEQPSALKDLGAAETCLLRWAR